MTTLEEIRNLRKFVEDSEKRIDDIQSACMHKWVVRLAEETSFPTKRLYIVECSECGRYLGELESRV